MATSKATTGRAVEVEAKLQTIEDLELSIRSLEAEIDDALQGLSLRSLRDVDRRIKELSSKNRIAQYRISKGGLQRRSYDVGNLRLTLAVGDAKLARMSRKLSQIEEDLSYPAARWLLARRYGKRPSEITREFRAGMVKAKQEAAAERAREEGYEVASRDDTRAGAQRFWELHEKMSKQAKP